jgi:diketogulonate reductase-like aldo/keto reductase
MVPDSSRDQSDVDALKLGLDLGMTLIDTAEMYGSGHSEEIVSRALKSWKKTVFVASKVSPSHFAHDDVLRSARKSLERLALKQMDLYQLHWPNPSIPISETMRAMERLVRDGLVRHIGVSNFSVEQMKEAQSALSKAEIVSNQVEYSLLDRSVERDILPYCQKHGMTLIAYSPLAQGRISNGRGGGFRVLDEIGRKLGKTRSQVALNWLLRNEFVIVIPKASDKTHVRENSQAAGWEISRENSEKLGAAFPS